jgi:hypothetical protein
LGGRPIKQPSFKDNFSANATNYAKFRPGYPNALFEFISSLPAERNCAWDSGTGNGQAAVGLASHFDQVVATDPSEKQQRSFSVGFDVPSDKLSAIELAARSSWFFRKPGAFTSSHIR